MKLIIAEKPSVAKEIAKVVGATTSKQGFLSGNDYLVSWCIGHLVQLATPELYDESLKKWDLGTLPIIPELFKNVVSSSVAAQFKVLKELMHRDDVDELIEATDAGREGELIFRLVYKQANCKKPFKRLWISSLEKKSIVEGMNNLKDGQEYDNLYRAALCRQQADWLVGINMTRLYTCLYGTLLKVGRVQTPTLNLIVERENEIKSFIPQPYWNVIAVLENFSAVCMVDDKNTLETILSRCKDKPATVKEILREEKKTNPDALYDLTTLQRDANRLLGYSAQETLNAMQKLYDGKLATYPRTDSRYITEDMEKSTIELVHTLFHANLFGTSIQNQYDLNKISVKRVVNNKKVTDHHAILPTNVVTREKLEALSDQEKNIMLLILHRLLVAVYVPYLYIFTKITLDIEEILFSATGKEVIDVGYKMINEELKKLFKTSEKNNEDEVILPTFQEGQQLEVTEITFRELKTKPPLSYTEDTLLSAMKNAGKNIEDKELKNAIKGLGLGTTATRAGIIENIIQSGYVKRSGTKLLPTEQGNRFIELLNEKIKQSDLTAHWEKKLAEISEGKLASEQFMNEIKDFVKSLTIEIKQSVKSETDATFKQANKRETIAKCPKCGRNILEFQKSYSCESGKDGCGFVVWKQIAGKNISKTQATKLISKGKTDLIKDFTSKNGKPFDAYLILKDDKSVGFEFKQSTPSKFKKSVKSKTDATFNTV